MLWTLVISEVQVEIPVCPLVITSGVAGYQGCDINSQGGPGTPHTYILNNSFAVMDLFLTSWLTAPLQTSTIRQPPDFYGSSPGGNFGQF